MYNTETDMQLLTLWRARRDADAFGELTRRHGPLVYSACLRILRNATAAEDAAQEAFLELVKSPSAIQSVPAWLHTAATRRAVDRLKAERARFEREQRYAGQQNQAVEPVWDDLSEHIDEAINGLPDKFRRPVVLRFLHGRTFSEISRDASIPVPTVQYRLNKGLDGIRRHLARRGIVTTSSALAAMLAAAPSQALPAAALQHLLQAATTWASTATVSAAIAIPAATTFSGGVSIMLKVAVALALSIAALATARAVLLPAGPSKDSVNAAQPAAPAPEAKPAQLAAAAAPNPQSTAPSKAEQVNPFTLLKSAFSEKRPIGNGVIRGEVISSIDGGPIAGAKIFAESLRWRKTELGPDYRHIWEAISDDQGKFRIERLPALVASVENPSRFAVRASKGDAAAINYVILFEDDPKAHTTLELRPAGSIGGIVTNADGAPVAGAWVEPVQAAAGESRVEGIGLRTKTRENGTFLLENLYLGQWQLSVYPKEYAPLLSLAFPTGTSDVSIVLGSGGRAEGKVVVMPDGEPAAGVSLRALRKDGGYDTTVLTDEAGAFVVDKLAATHYTLKLDEKEELVSLGTPLVFQITGDETVSNLVFNTALGAIVAGRVFDADTGEPLVNCRISLASDLLKTVFTDADGLYRLEGLPAGQITLRRRWFEGYAHGERRENKDLSVKAGQVIDGIDFPVKQAFRVSGTVVDAEGNPVDHVDVRTHDLSETGEGEGSQTGEDGEFVHRGFSANTKIKFTAVRPGYALLPMDDITFEGADISGVKLVLDKGGSIEGAIFDTGGKPLPDYYINAQSQGETPISQQAISRVGGVFKVEGLLVGQYALQARSIRSGQLSPTLATVKVGEGEEVRDLRLVLNTSAGLTIEGRVTDEKGAPVAGASLSASPITEYSWKFQESSVADATTDAEGRYSLEGLAEGPYSVAVRHTLYSPSSDGAEAGSTVNFVLQGLGSIEGTVVSAKGPVESFEIIVGSSGARARYLDPTGRFLITQVPVGTGQLEVRAEGFAAVKTAVAGVTSGGKVTGVVIQLEPGATLSGTVLDPQGKLIQGAEVVVQIVEPSVEVTPDGMATGYSVTSTDALGRFSVDFLELGNAKISARHELYSPAEVEIQLGPGANDVELQLSAGGIIQGVVTMGGQPLPNAFVMAHDQGVSKTTETDEAGRFELKGVPAGEVRVNVTAAVESTSHNVSETAIVADNQVTELNLNIQVGDSSVEGYITLDGEPVADTHVNLQSATPDPQSLSGRTDSSGFYRIDGVFPGAGVLNAHVPGAAGKPVAEIETQAGQTTRHDFDYSSGVVVSGTVSGVTPGTRVHINVLQGEQSVPDLSIETLRALSPHAVTSAWPGEDGTFQFQPLEPGQYTLLVFSTLESQAQDLSATPFYTEPLTVSAEGSNTVHITHP